MPRILHFPPASRRRTNTNLVITLAVACMHGSTLSVLSNDAENTGENETNAEDYEDRMK